MSYLKFYRDEHARWPQLHGISITDAWAQRALKKLTRHFHVDRMGIGGAVPLRFAGRTTSWGGAGGIALARGRDWLIFVHEFAHVLEYRKYGVTEHRKRMAKIVDRVARYVLKMGWAEQDLDEQFAAFCENEAGKVPYPTDAEIAEIFEPVREAMAAGRPVDLFVSKPLPRLWRHFCTEADNAATDLIEATSCPWCGKREKAPMPPVETEVDYRSQDRIERLARCERRLRLLRSNVRRVKRSIAYLKKALGQS